MAKSKTKSEPTHIAGAPTVVVEIPEGLILTYGDWQIEAASASPATLAYCLQNGFHQSMVDAAAFSKDEKTNADGTAKTNDEIEAMAYEKRTARFDNIVAGSVGHRSGGPRAKGIDVYIRDVLDKLIAERASAKGAKLPTGKGAAEKLAAFRTQLMSNASIAEQVRARAQTAMDADKAMASEVDLDFGTAA